MNYTTKAQKNQKTRTRLGLLVQKHEEFARPSVTAKLITS